MANNNDTFFRDKVPSMTVRQTNCRTIPTSHMAKATPVKRRSYGGSVVTDSCQIVNLMLLLSSVQYNQTFSTTPAGNSRQFYPRPRYSREHCTRYCGFYIFFNPVPAENPRVSAGLAPYPRPCKTLYQCHFV